MRVICTIMLLLIVAAASAQLAPVTRANYQRGRQVCPRKLGKLIFSTSVDPHWLKKSDRFWYVYETTDGKKWYIVDPAKGEKKLMFDNALLAAKLTRIVKDPFDAQHLNIDSLRFVKDENWIQFEVKSTEEIVKKDTSAAAKGKGCRRSARRERKVFYFRIQSQYTGAHRAVRFQEA